MKCPACKDFVQVEDRTGVFKCRSCGSLLRYDKRTEILSVYDYKNDNFDQSYQPEYNDSYPSLVKLICYDCGGTIPIDDASYTHSVECPFCKQSWLYNATKKDIEAKTKIKELDQKIDLKKLEYDHQLKLEEQRHKQKIENEKNEYKQEIYSMLFIILSTIFIFATFYFITHH